MHDDVMLVRTFQQFLSGCAPLGPAVGGQKSHGRLLLLRILRLLIDPQQLILNICVIQLTGTSRHIQNKEL